MGLPVVFLPPTLCDARVFAPQIATLSRARPVTVAPVHLAERADEVASALLSVLPQHFALIGAGYGATVALEILRHAPERVERLALIAGTALACTPQEASAREPVIIAARMGRMDDVLAHEVPTSALAATARRPEILDLVRRMGTDLGAQAFVAQTRAMQRRRDYTSTLRQMPQPLLVIGGAQDTIYPPKRQQFITEMATDAVLEIIEGAGHLPTLEQPEIVTGYLEQWLGQPMILR